MKTNFQYDSTATKKAFRRFAVVAVSNHESHPHTILIQRWWDETLPRLPERTTAVGTTTGSGELSTIVLSTSSPERKETIDERGKLLKKKEKNSSLTPEMREKIELKKRQAQEIKAQRIRAALEAERIQNEKKFGITSGPTRENLERFNGRTGSSDEIKVATEEKDFISLEDQQDKHLMLESVRWERERDESGKNKPYMTDPRCSEDQLKVLDLVCDCYPEASPFSFTAMTRISRGNSVVDPSSSMALVFLCGGGWLKFPSEWGNMGDEINLEEGGRSLSSRAKDQREQELELGDLGMDKGLRGRDW
ncbi:hypothetical protein BY996DRAFT_6525834 [Phakopsora pachyrhizi]|nr:hypothetical protein BY996DRAFT_6525834 [Phakopsora pachyrhizi]